MIKWMDLKNFFRVFVFVRKSINRVLGIIIVFRFFFLVCEGEVRCNVIGRVI